MRRIFWLLAVAGILSACSGTVTGVSPTAAPTAEPTGGLDVATQRYEAQAGIVLGEGIQAASLAAIAVATLNPQRRMHSAPVCRDGVEYTVKPVNPEQYVVTIDVFYDAKCTTKLAHSVLDVTFFLPVELSFSGKVTTYDQAGKAVAYGTLSNKTTLGSATQSVTRGQLSRTADGPAVAAFGLSCTLAKKNACGFGGLVAVSQQQSIGVTAMLQNFVESGSASDGVVAMTGYTGTPASLALARGKGNAWVIRGGSVVADWNGTFTENVDAQSLEVDGTLAIRDSVAGADVAEKFGLRSGVADGSVGLASTGRRLATYATDAAGTGSITYSDKSTGNITFFIIRS
ncbi:MAG TPA: hypothetical protein VMH02_05910 [Verrucomicrobiae bacterium]|nr:hypothetical protein [Verrucomicrobiae bacterium]